jgi:hypothetical protein
MGAFFYSVTCVYLIRITCVFIVESREATAFFPPIWYKDGFMFIWQILLQLWGQEWVGKNDSFDGRQTLSLPRNFHWSSHSPSLFKQWLIFVCFMALLSFITFFWNIWTVTSNKMLLVQSSFRNAEKIEIFEFYPVRCMFVLELKNNSKNYWNGLCVTYL